MSHDSPLWKSLGWALGVLGPVLCFAVDPGLFRRGENVGLPWYPVSLAAYLAVAICSSTFASVLLTPAVGPARRGVLFAGAVVASLFALLLLPLASMAGLVLAAEATHSGAHTPELQKLWLLPLGWMPLGTALVFWRAFARAPARPGPAFAFRLAVGALASVSAVAAPISAQSLATHLADRAAQRVAVAPQTARARDLRVLNALAFTSNLDPLVRAWAASQDPEDKRALADTYKNVTGAPIERAAFQLLD
jgi:hypothetical protein